MEGEIGGKGLKVIGQSNAKNGAEKVKLGFFAQGLIHRVRVARVKLRFMARKSMVLMRVRKA